jgi:Salmonella virulence plasmid 65kDa B protein
MGHFLRGRRMRTSQRQGDTKEAGTDQPQPPSPSISLSKSGGAIRGIGEKFAANPVTGTGSLSVPIFTSPGRAGFGPQLSLSYDSGSGNGPFGFGWDLSLPSITRKADKGLPRYLDAEESDTFILGSCVASVR